MSCFQKRQPQDPSPQFIRNYFSGFANDPIINSLNGEEKQEAGTPDRETDEKEKLEEMEKDDHELSSYKKALRQFKNKQYNDITELCGDEIQLQESSSHLAESLLLRATFCLLRSETDRAMEDFERLLSMDGVDKRIRSNALIKRGALKMQQGMKEESLEDFNEAAAQDPENSDIYHHRGQYHILLENVEEAVKDFEKSVALSPNFPVAHVQKCYTDFRMAAMTSSMLIVESAMKTFEKTVERFPNCTEGYALYGQSLTDMKEFEKADENFKRALELEPDNGNIYVHRGLLRLQWKQDIDEASRLINKAMEVDDKCEFAYETLGTIEIQRGHLDKAVDLFNRAIELAKTEAEMAHLYSLLDAAVSQSKVAQYLGIQLPTMM
jgi:import receptor subunit TOM70